MTPGEWMRCGNTERCAEIFDDGDDVFLVRSSYNRDRVLRLTRTELLQLAYMIKGNDTRPVDPVVGEIVPLRGRWGANAG